MFKNPQDNYTVTSLTSIPFNYKFCLTYPQGRKERAPRRSPTPEASGDDEAFDPDPAGSKGSKPGPACS